MMCIYMHICASAQASGYVQFGVYAVLQGVRETEEQLAPMHHWRAFLHV